jgi:hypothetical protein
VARLQNSFFEPVKLNLELAYLAVKLFYQLRIPVKASSRTDVMAATVPL